MTLSAVCINHTRLPDLKPGETIYDLDLSERTIEFLLNRQQASRSRETRSHRLMSSSYTSTQWPARHLDHCLPCKRKCRGECAPKSGIEFCLASLKMCMWSFDRDCWATWTRQTSDFTFQSSLTKVMEYFSLLTIREHLTGFSGFL